MLNYLYILSISLLLLLVACAPPEQILELQQAFDFAYEGKINEALFSSEIYLRNHPEDINALLLNSFCILKSNSTDAQKGQAVFNLDKALRLAPESFAANYFYGWALAETGQDREAIPILEKALQLMPENSDKRAELFLLLGRCSSNNNLHDKGMNYLQPLRIYEPYRNWSEIYNRMAILSLKQQNYKKAEAYFREALRIDHRNPKLLQNLAITYDLYINNVEFARYVYIQCMMELNDDKHKKTRQAIQNRLQQIVLRE